MVPKSVVSVMIDIILDAIALNILKSCYFVNPKIGINLTEKIKSCKHLL